MPDPSMALALGIAQGLGPPPALPPSLEPVERRAELAHGIDGTFVAGPGPSEQGEQIGRRLGDIAVASSEFVPDVPGELERLKIVLRLWSGCLDAAKTVALETMDGPNTPELRARAFPEIDARAGEDPIYRAGVEAAPAFKKLRRQNYSFAGVPGESPVRRYPNEFLLP